MALAAGASAGPLFPPGAPPADTIDVVDLAGAPRDTLLTAATLQGLVNGGETSRLYLVFSDADRFWLDELERKGHIKGHEPLEFDACLSKYASEYGKVIVYDPAVPASVNVATMMASLERGVVVAPDHAELPTGGKEAEDLRGRWKTNAEAYRWAFENLWPKMNHGLLACYHPTGLPHSLRDYLVRNKVFHFWVTSKEKADGDAADHEGEKAFLEEVLSKTAANVPVLGFWYSGPDAGINEYAGVGLAGEYGKLTVVSDFCSNLSLLSGVKADVGSAVAAYRKRVDIQPPELDPGKVYICVDITESGDAPSYLQTRQAEVWKDAKRGEAPINWSMGPSILDLAPPIAAYYFEHATPKDYLYASISGAAYVHPYRDFMAKTPNPEAAWTQYLGLTRAYMMAMGCCELGLYTDAWKPFDRETDDAVTGRFIEAIPWLECVVLGMGRDEGMNALNGNYLAGGKRVLVSHILTRWPVDYAKRSREENLAWLVEDIRSHTPEERPAFMHVMALSWAYGPSEIVEVLEELGAGYVPLTIPQLSRLFVWTKPRNALSGSGEQKPGARHRTRSR